MTCSDDATGTVFAKRARSQKPDLYGTVYGMHRTTVYLLADLKRDLERVDQALAGFGER